MTCMAHAFVASSGTGKTTLPEKVIVELKRRRYRVGTIKHDTHGFDIDHPGKDGYRLTAAGADTILISSRQQLAPVTHHQTAPPIENLIEAYFNDVDIVLIEGARHSSLPKIEVHRKEHSPCLLCRGEKHDPLLLAIASDEPLTMDVPVLDINDASRIADFIEERMLQ